MAIDIPIFKLNVADNGYYNYGDPKNPKPTIEYLNLIKEENEKNGFNIKLIDFKDEILKKIKLNSLNIFIYFSSVPTLLSDYSRIRLMYELDKEIIYVDDDIVLNDELLNSFIKSQKLFYNKSFCFCHYIPEKHKKILESILQWFLYNYRIYKCDSFIFHSDSYKNEIFSNDPFKEHAMLWCYKDNKDDQVREIKKLNIPDHIKKSCISYILNTRYAT